MKTSTRHPSECYLSIKKRMMQSLTKIRLLPNRSQECQTALRSIFTLIKHLKKSHLYGIGKIQLR